MNTAYVFLQFRWWKMPGLNCAIWYCHKKYTTAQKALLLNDISMETENDRSIWMVRLLNLGRPSLLSKLQSGTDYIWVTDLTINEKQRSELFPKLFHGSLNPDIAGITIKKVDGRDRPNYHENDLCVDVVITFYPADEAISPSPIFHREQIPDWSAQQRTLLGRHTTGPLFTPWWKY